MPVSSCGIETSHEIVRLEVRLPPAGGLHLGLLPLLGGLIGGEVTLTKPSRIEMHQRCCSPSILTPSSGSVQPVRWNRRRTRRDRRLSELSCSGPSSRQALCGSNHWHCRATPSRWKHGRTTTRCGSRPSPSSANVQRRFRDRTAAIVILDLISRLGAVLG
jgi:hypothetical protein